MKISFLADAVVYYIIVRCKFFELMEESRCDTFQCLKYNIVPFIIEDNLKMFYYRGLKEWDKEKGYLTDTCLTAQDQYKAYLDYFRIKY